jgi:ArsR family transcriptional regulator, lead/cadmium/zinc/bismuth-responsive transcriptional repressor
MTTRHNVFMNVKMSQAGGLDRSDSACVEPERVADVRERLPNEGTGQALAETFRILADPGRVRLILALLEAGELCVCDLAAATGLTETACSHNLRLLRSGRLVRYRRQGRNVYYRLDDAHIRLLLDVARQHVGHVETVS